MATATYANKLLEIGRLKHLIQWAEKHGGSRQVLASRKRRLAKVVTWLEEHVDLASKGRYSLETFCQGS